MCPPPQSPPSATPSPGSSLPRVGWSRGKDCQGRAGRVWAGGHPPDIGRGGKGCRQALGRRNGSGRWEAGAPLKAGSSLGVCASPQWPPWEERRELEAVPGAVCVCLQGWGPEESQGGGRVGGFPVPKSPLSPFQLWGSQGVSFACAQLQLVPCRREGGCLPSFLGSVLCLCVCLSVLIPHPPRRVWGSLRVCGTGPLPIPSPVFISHCTTATVMPNKTTMGSVVWLCSGQDGGGSQWGHSGVTVGLCGPSVQQPQHGQGSALPAHKGTTKNGENAPGDESSPAATRAEAVG